MAYLYILYSSLLDNYYVGSTKVDVAERLKKHLSNHSGFTSRAKDWIVVYTEHFETKSLAYQREMEIKKKKSRKYIEYLIDKK